MSGNVSMLIWLGKQYLDQSEKVVETGDYQVLGATARGETLQDLGPVQTGLLVFGNEGWGIRAEYAKYCTGEIAISGAHTLGAESLNVAAAVAVICAYFKTGQP